MQKFCIFALFLAINELLKVKEIKAKLGIGRSTVAARI